MTTNTVNKLKALIDRILILLGMKLTKEQMLLNHLSKLEILLKAHPADKMTWLSKGALLYELKNFEEALECFDFVLSMDESNLDAMTKRGLCFFQLGRYEDAVNCFDICLEKNPYNSSAWFNKGMALTRLERYDEAITLFDKMSIINDRDPLVWLGKSNVYAAQGKMDDAGECLEKAQLPLSF